MVGGDIVKILKRIPLALLAGSILSSVPAATYAQEAPRSAVQPDDVPLAFQARPFADLSDIARIEVLRGPQSPLYGKSASAGLINIAPPAPSRDWTVKAHALVPTDSEYTIGGTVSGPLSKDLGIRVTVNRDDFKGNVHNLFTGHKVN